MVKAARRKEEYKQTFTVNDLLLVEFERIGSSIIKFSVQYIARINEEWQSIVRYDTAHGYAHTDISHPDGTQETRELKGNSYREALAIAIAEVKLRWEFFRERYERWLE